MAARERDAVFVLVHSPLVGPLAWSRVAEELGRRGREAVVPSLLAVADAQAPQWTVAVHAVRVATAQTRGPLLLAGHSGAGLLLPAIAGGLTAKVAALVFVDSFLPPQATEAELASPAIKEQLATLATGDVLPPWSEWFGSDAMSELVRDERLRAALEDEMPHLPLAYFDGCVPLPDGWDAVACGYLLLAEEPYADSAAEAARRGWKVSNLPGANHLAPVTDPAAVADALLNLESRLLTEPQERL